MGAHHRRLRCQVWRWIERGIGKNKVVLSMTSLVEFPKVCFLCHGDTALFQLVTLRWLLAPP